MSRAWCPALSADAYATFDVAHLGERPQSPGPAKEPRQVSEHAAHVASASVQKVYASLNKIAASPPSKFSAKIANSSARSEATMDGQFILPVPSVTLQPLVPDEEGLVTFAAPQPVTIRSVAHLSEVANDLTSAGVGHVDLSRVDAFSEELSGVIRNELSEVPLDAITIRHSIKGTLGVQAVLEALTARNRQLRYLDVSSNPVAFSLGGEEPNAPCAEALVKYIAANPQLNVLQVGSTGAGAAGASVFPALKSHSGLTSLDLSRNGLGLMQDEAIVAAFLSVVQENKFLLRLDLSDNDIGGTLAKQLVESLRTSDTRMKTPEPEPEPEAEEYTDEVPPEEEAPQVVVGFPEDAQPPATETGDEPAADAGPTDPPPVLDTTAEPEGGAGDEDQEEADAVVPASPTPDEGAGEAEEEDPEAAEAARLEREEAEREEYRRLEEAWRARMTQYIWEPEQILFLYSEAVARRNSAVSYVTETMDLKKTEKAEKLLAKQAQLTRERTERQRRSGWSHLQELNLSGNPLGNAAIKVLASALRHRIPFTAEERQTADEDFEKRLAAAKADARAAILKERTLQAAADAAAVQPEVAPPTQDEEPAAEAPAEESINAEDVAVEDDAIPPVPEDPPRQEEAEGDEAAAAEAQDEDDIDTSHVTVTAAESTKPGITTVRALRLDASAVGNAGLVQLAKAVAEDCPSLQLLSLRKNKFGTKKQSVVIGSPQDGEAKEDEGDDEGSSPTVRVEIPDWVSPGLSALSSALKTSRNLAILDLGWNRLYPNSIRTLAAGIRDNTSLSWLGLEGNKIGFVEAETPQQSALAVLLEAVATQGRIHTVMLGSSELESSLRETEVTLLATIPQLKHICLSGNQLTAAQIAMWGHVANNLDDEVPRTSLETLLLENIVSLEGLDGGAAVGSVLQSCKGTLRTLSLKGCQQLGDDGVTKVAGKFSVLSELERINLSRCGIVSSCEIVAAAIAQRLQTLTTVDISDNEVPAEDYIQAITAWIDTLADIGTNIPLRRLSVWSRSGDSEDLLPSLVALTAKAKSLVACDIGIPPLFTKAASNIAPQPNVVYEDLFEELEKLCLRNRITSQTV